LVSLGLAKIKLGKGTDSKRKSVMMRFVWNVISVLS
jgi:hypothetical protein